MSNRCICYTTDPGYLFPTFVSAMQARRHAPTHIADVAIFSIGVPAQQEAAFAHASAQEGIRFLSVPSKHLDGASAMLARLFLDRIVPADYDQLLYIDGDTQITNTLVPLLQAQVPPGHFCAASDPMTFSLQSSNRSDQQLINYFSSIGLNATKQRTYFNSGVLRINRTGWNEIGHNSWILFQKLRGRSRYPDQDALNLAAMEQRIPMSLVWNFPIFLRNARLEADISPHIVHYMGSPKPWHGQFMPWGAAEYDAYLAAAHRYPALIPFLSHMPWPRKLKYMMQQRYKKIQETAIWGSGRRHHEILHYESRMRLGMAPPAIRSVTELS